MSNIVVYITINRYIIYVLNEKTENEKITSCSGQSMVNFRAEKVV